MIGRSETILLNCIVDNLTHSGCGSGAAYGLTWEQGCDDDGCGWLKDK